MTASAATKAVSDGIHQLEAGSFNLSGSRRLGSKGIAPSSRAVVCARLNESVLGVQFDLNARTSALKTFLVGPGSASRRLPALKKKARR